MKIHYIQHAAFEKPGYIREYFKELGAKQSVILPYENEPFPEPGEIEMLVIMGGPMSVNDEIKYPWLIKEKKFIEKAILGGKPVLGICLGSQMIANVLGSVVFQNTQPEIGWYPLHFTRELGIYLHGDLPFETIGFHWHGDTYELPANSVRLASSAATRNQGFVFEDKVVGLQFHPETNKNTIEDLIAHGRHQLIPGDYVQSESEIREGIHYASPGNQLIERIILRMLEKNMQ